MNEKEYPYNLIRKVIGPITDIENVWLKKFNDLVHYTLTNQEGTIIHLYYYGHLTLAEVAEKLNLSKSRVTQIRDKAITKLRHQKYKYYVPTIIDAYENKITDLKKLLEIKRHPKTIRPIENDILIDDLDLSVRTFNCLRRYGIAYLSEITSMTENKLKQIHNMGRYSVQEIKDKLAEYGLSLKEETQND